jgi:hypothetical protein
VDRVDARLAGSAMLFLFLSACTHSRPATVSWGSFDPDEKRTVAAGHLPFRGELEVGATYEAFGAVVDDSPDPDGELRIVASRYAPEYFPRAIHWRNGADALQAVEPGEWHAVVFDVVTVTESAVDERGSVAWVPVYECDLDEVVPVPSI